jgi:hypothetical protein
MLPFLECAFIATGAAPLLSSTAGGVDDWAGVWMAEEGLEAVADGGPRDQAEVFALD